jgi:hypothetical protein
LEVSALEGLSLKQFGGNPYQKKLGYLKRMLILKKKREVLKKDFGIYKKRLQKNGLSIINRIY